MDSNTQIKRDQPSPAANVSATQTFEHMKWRDLKMLVRLFEAAMHPATPNPLRTWSYEDLCDANELNIIAHYVYEVRLAAGEGNNQQPA